MHRLLPIQTHWPGVGATKACRQLASFEQLASAGPEMNAVQHKREAEALSQRITQQANDPGIDA